MPNEICEAIGFHHMPSEAMRHKMLTSLVYIADVMVRKMGIGDSGNFAEPVVDDVFAQKVKLPVNLEEIETRRGEIVQQVDAIVSFE